MHPVQTLFRILTWCCVILLAVLSLLPAQDMVRTGIPGELEHFVAYAGSASIAIGGYGRRGAARIIGLFWIYAGILEYLQHFFAGPASVDREFCSISCRRVLRRGRWSLPRASPGETCLFGRHLI